VNEKKDRFDRFLRGVGAVALAVVVVGLLSAQVGYVSGSKSRQITCDANGELLSFPSSGTGAFSPSKIIVLGNASANVYVHPTSSTSTTGAVIGLASGAHGTSFDTEAGNGVFSCTAAVNTNVNIVGVR
jgi:hypothetical protein